MTSATGDGGDETPTGLDPDLMKRFKELAIIDTAYPNASKIVERRLKNLRVYAVDGLPLCKEYESSAKLTEQLHQTCEDMMRTFNILNPDSIRDTKILIMIAHNNLSKAESDESKKSDIPEGYIANIKTIRESVSKYCYDRADEASAEDIIAEVEASSANMDKMDQHVAKMHAYALFVMCKQMRQYFDLIPVFELSAMLTRGLFYFYVVDEIGARADREVLEPKMNKLIDDLSWKPINALPIIGQIIEYGKLLSDIYNLRRGLEGEHQRVADSMGRAKDFVEIYMQSLIVVGRLLQAAMASVDDMVEQNTRMIEAATHELSNEFWHKAPTK